MAAVMCMLTNTEMADQARGAVMSQVLSMHSGVAKLLGEKTGHPGQLIKARMGDVDSWTGRSKDSSRKVSKHWRFNAQADGSIKCSGLAVDLQRLHGALGGGQHLNCEYANWDGDVPKATFEALLNIAPWTKMERKQTKAESSKENGDTTKKNSESGPKTAPKGKASKGGETPHSSAPPPVYTDRGVALSSALAAAAVLRQQLSAEQSEESAGALRQLDAALTYIEGAPDEAVSCGPNGLGLGVEGDTVRPARPLLPRPHSGLTPAPGRLPLHGAAPLCAATHAVLTPPPAWQLTVVFPCTDKTEVQLSTTPSRTRARLRLSNPTEARDPVKGLEHNGLVGMQPGVFTTDHIAVPGGRTMRDMTPPAGQAGGRKRPRGVLWFEPAGEGKAWGFGQFGITLLPEAGEVGDEDEFV